MSNTGVALGFEMPLECLLPIRKCGEYDAGWIRHIHFLIATQHMYMNIYIYIYIYIYIQCTSDIVAMDTVAIQIYWPLKKHHC